MWNILMFAVMMALTGFYATSGERTIATARQANAMSMASSMQLYRAAVSAYFTKHDKKNTSVNFATLKASNLLPSWSTLYSSGDTPLWDNYRAADGTIYIYAATLPPVNIVSEMVQLSKNSILAGVYQRGSPNLYSPIVGDTGIPLTDLVVKSPPNGAPVWIAMRN
jgi:hypothetical protein